MFSLSEFLLRIKGYFSENYGAPLVIGFTILLMAAAGLLIAGNSTLAGNIALIAYCLLVFGVVLQAVSLARNRGETAEEE